MENIPDLYTFEYVIKASNIKRSAFVILYAGNSCCKYHPESALSQCKQKVDSSIFLAKNGFNLQSALHL